MVAVRWRSLASFLLAFLLFLHCLSFLLLDKFGKVHRSITNNQCNFNSSLGATVFSSPDFVHHYINFSSCSQNNYLRVKSYLGRQGEIKVEANYTYWPLEKKSLCQQDWDEEVSLVYLVLNPGSEARSRSRRLWTSKVGKSSSVRFLLLQKKGKEWKREIRAEQEVHKDIIVTNIREDEKFAHVHLVTSALFLIFSKCPIVRYLALVQGDVYVNTQMIESFATAETMAANRIYGDLHRDYGPSRDPLADHYVPSRLWPWHRFPPFLGPNLLLFSSDTLPRLLHSLPSVPPFNPWEVWLSGLVGIQAEVLRIGVKDFFAPLTRKAPPCSWLRYGAISGVKGSAEEQLLNSKILLRGNLSSCNESKPSDDMVKP